MCVLLLGVRCLHLFIIRLAPLLALTSIHGYRFGSQSEWNSFAYDYVMLTHDSYNVHKHSRDYI